MVGTRECFRVSKKTLFSHKVVWADSCQKENLSRKDNTKWVSKVKGKETDPQPQNGWYQPAYRANSQCKPDVEGRVLLASESVLL